MTTTQELFGSQMKESAFDAADFAHVRSQEAAKRALTIAIAGGHSVTLFGPPGHGKTMLAKAALAICPGLPIFEFTIIDHTDRPSMLAHREAVNADIHVEVPAVPFRELFGKRHGTNTTEIRKRADAGRDALQGIPAEPLHGLSAPCIVLFKQAYDELGLTPYGATIIARVARTIAALNSNERITEIEIAEAVQYRLLDRKF